MLTPKVGFILLFVKNPIKSANFYSKILNIKPIELSPTFALFKLENTMLGLWSSFTAEPRVESSAGASEISFEYKNVDVLFQLWSMDFEITIAQKPTDMDFGRTFVALDPDGHRIRIYKLNE